MTMFADENDHQKWLGVARRYVRPGIEPADVLQEASIAAMRDDRADLSLPANQRYFRGILRKTAWAMRRADARRARHERLRQVGGPPRDRDDAHPAPDLSGLPTSLQAVANLVMANLDRNEIRSALGISDEALRRRLSDLRRHLQKLSMSREQFEASVRGRQEVTAEDIGLVRQALLAWLQHTPSGGGAVGTVDPDGHLIAVAEKSAWPLTESRSPATESRKEDL